MNKLILIFSLILFQVVSSQNNAIYFDKDWKKTSKANAAFYRPIPMKEVGELVLIRDFYMNGTLQFEGYTFKNNEEKYVGDISYYDENGNNSSFRQYINKTKNSTLEYYHANGKIRKTVHYKDGLKDGETAVYDNNGEVLMKGIYKNGKPVSGDFEFFSEDYDYNRGDEEEYNSNENTTEAQAIIVRPMMQNENTSRVETPTKKPENKTLKTISQKIFWRDSRVLAQELVYSIESYGRDLIQQKNYDKSGKLIQNITENNLTKYGNPIINGTEYKYFEQNNFAKEVKSTTPYVKEKITGKSTAYFPSGKILSETHYKDWQKENEIIYTENGTIKTKRIYKENDPYEGNFDENIGEFTVNLNYQNGKKEGEAIAKNEDGKIFAKGVYKNNEPYNGTFVVKLGRDNDEELINVENSKKTGLQKKFGHRIENLKETYTIQNEKLNGITTFYKDEEPIATLVYKDDEPMEGTLIEEESSTIFKNGQIVSEIYQDRYALNDENIVKQKFYENNQIAKIQDYSFSIVADPQEFYTGIFKNGKPFSGYFENDENREFKQVNYYENGQPKFQYSNDYLSNMDEYRHQYYDIKSTFKDGKIYDGIEYTIGSKQFISKYLTNGELKSFDWDLFAMNYFNRIHFELNGNSIEMHDLQENKKAKITLDFSEDNLSVKLYTDNYIVDERTYNTNKNLAGKFVESIITYRIEGEKLISNTIQIKFREHDNYAGSKFFYHAYSLINDEFKTAQNVFNNLSEIITLDKMESGEIDGNIISGVRLDPYGKPTDGTLITELPGNKYKIQVYEDGKLINTINNVAFKNLETELKKAFGRN
ncbi:toxin-antitoxin system YwqK family antitoxin [Frigoriflavimonas asaccharolytica]|uniref:Antitoxin component YwqK of YwqJK toxin-antitoxin module n=1 Tax=Frigoriflavimonas asaccharolytica TaxID=2735899 RepID=A0A8J8G7U1_9FLAO|nr:hypothetical protein [Frigoriflavimonas asaccharolytica]NRS92270.1 antitoxin component YwqK of YwqJK toxin-antitoxin module [Frigoriflavimonas asaccharolytica]